MVKTLKNLLLQNRKSYDLETWHVASGTLFCMLFAQVSGERLQDHWSSGLDYCFVVAKRAAL